MIFHELSQRLSVVPRWTIVRTIQKQSVAEHCFNVARIAEEVAVRWFNINPQSEIMRDILTYALHHDDDEAITGDIPSPAKYRLREEYLDASHSPWYHVSEDARRIVKLADLMEAYWFLMMERRLGNQYCEVHRLNIHKQICQYTLMNFDEGSGLQDKFKEWSAELNRSVSRVYND